MFVMMMVTVMATAMVMAMVVAMEMDLVMVMAFVSGIEKFSSDRDPSASVLEEAQDWRVFLVLYRTTVYSCSRFVTVAHPHPLLYFHLHPDPDPDPLLYLHPHPCFVDMKRVKECLVEASEDMEMLKDVIRLLKVQTKTYNCKDMDKWLDRFVKSREG